MNFYPNPLRCIVCDTVACTKTGCLQEQLRVNLETNNYDRIAAIKSILMRALLCL